MDKRKRILVVEDDPGFRETCLANLQRHDYRVDGVSNLQEALEATNQCAYHVAIVDIMLAGEKDISNRDGVEVVRHIKNLDEGTRMVVLSEQTERELIRDFLVKHGTFDYITKSKAHQEGISLLLRTVERALVANPLDVVLSWESLIKYIAWPIGEDRFVSECFRLLNFKGGFATLSNLLTSACNSLTPLLLNSKVDKAMTFDEEEKIARGRFWSKGQGKAVEIMLWGKIILESASEVPFVSDQHTLYTRSKAGLSVAVTDKCEASRKDFLVL